MIRFVLRLVGALLVEKLLRDKRRPTYFHGIRIHPRNTIPKSGAKYTLQETDGWFESDYMFGVSGTIPEGADVSTSLIPGGTFKCKQASASGILPFSPIYEELPADFAPGYRVTRQGATMYFTSTDPCWKDG